FLGRASETIEALGDGDILEAEATEERDETCLRQSAGDSTAPEIDVAANRLRELRRDHDVSVQELPPGLEHPEHLAEGLFLVGRQIQDAVRDDDIDAPRVDR